jgi:hypothetical protein
MAFTNFSLILFWKENNLMSPGPGPESDAWMTCAGISGAQGS